MSGDRFPEAYGGSSDQPHPEAQSLLWTRLGASGSAVAATASWPGLGLRLLQVLQRGPWRDPWLPITISLLCLSAALLVLLVASSCGQERCFFPLAFLPREPGLGLC